MPSNDDDVRDDAAHEARMLSDLNAFPISKRELARYLKECNRVRLPNDEDGDNTFIAATMIATRLSKKSKNAHLKAMALWTRMAAMARVVSAGAPGWVLDNRSPDGMRVVQEAMLAAAAVEPLVKGDDGHFMFDHDSFLRRVLNSRSESPRFSERLADGW